MRLGDLIDRFGDIIQLLITVAAGVALLAFFWGLFKYIFKAQSEKEKSEGKNIMVWGTLALFVMVTVWGIIFFFQRELWISNVRLRQGGESDSLAPVRESDFEFYRPGLPPCAPPPQPSISGQPCV